MKQLLTLILVLLIWGCAPKQTEVATFQNPVIFADVPDVDIVRVGADYYMVSTTMHLSPGAPVMHSKDLVHWETVSYLFDRLDESPKNDLEGGHIYGRGQWASSIRYHEGLYYVLFGTGNRTYIYTTRDPHGKWEKRCELEEYLHDASLLFDEGHIYIAYGAGEIRIVELEEDFSALKKDGVNALVINREPAGLLEGTHLYKLGDTYYMMVIWWPKGGIRTQLCFRSKQIDGPYAMQVVLSDDLGFERHGVAQGCLIDTEAGDWYAMLFQDHEAVGRVPVLMPCRWVDGWPMLGDAEGKVPHTMPIPVQGVEPKGAMVVSDSFDSPTLGLTWQWNHNPDNALWSLGERPGFMRLKTGKVVESIFEARNTLSQRTEGPRCRAAVKLDISAMQAGDRAGLSLYCSEPGTLTVSRETTGTTLSMTDRGAVMEAVPLECEELWLAAECDFTTDTARFSYSLDGEAWQPLGKDFHMIYNLVHFMGNRFAIFNYATEAPGGWVDVDEFCYERID